jgi:hypothetical protein
MKLHNCHGGYILNVRELGITIIWPVKFPFRPLYPPGKATGTCWIWWCEDVGDVLEMVLEKCISTTLRGFEYGRPARSKLPYGLSSEPYAYTYRSQDSLVGTATGYGLDNRGLGFRIPVWSRISYYPRRPNRLWSPPSLLTNGHRWLFPRGWRGGAVKLTIHVRLVPRSRKSGSIYPFPHTPWRSAQLV